MFNDDDFFFFRKLLDDTGDFQSLVDIKIGGRLIKKIQINVFDKRSSDGNKLELSTRDRSFFNFFIKEIANPKFFDNSVKFPVVSAFFSTSRIFPLTIFGSWSTYCGLSTQVMFLSARALKCSWSSVPA